MVITHPSIYEHDEIKHDTCTCIIVWLAYSQPVADLVECISKSFVLIVSEIIL